MYVFDYSEYNEQINEILTAIEGDFVFGVIEELTVEGLYTKNTTPSEMNRFCRKVMTVCIATTIAYQSWRDREEYYSKIMDVTANAIEEYLKDMVEMDVLYEEDGVAYDSSWASFVPDSIPFNIRSLDDINDIADIVSGIAVDNVHEVPLHEDQQFKSMLRRVKRAQDRTIPDLSEIPDIEVDVSMRTYTLYEKQARRINIIGEIERGLRH